MKTENNSQLGLELPEGEVRWPPHERFPFNFGGSTVGQQVIGDLSRSKRPLIITGYASLEELLGYFSDQELKKQNDPTSQG